MAYNKTVYKALRSLKVPYKIALALANSDSPLEVGDGEVAVTLDTEQTIEGEKTFAKPPKVVKGEDSNFLKSATFIDDYGVMVGAALRPPVDEQYLMFGFEDLAIEVGDTLRVDIRVQAGVTPAEQQRPAFSLWTTTGDGALEYDEEVASYVYATNNAAEQTLSLEVEDWASDRFILYFQTYYAPDAEVRSVRVWINDVEQVYTPELTNIPVLTGVREVVFLTHDDSPFTVTKEHVGKVIVCLNVDYIYLPFSKAIPIGGTVDIITLDQPADLFLRPEVDARAGYPDADGQLLGKGATVGSDGVAVLFGNIKMDIAGARVTCIKVPSVVGTDPLAWGPDAWLLTGDYILPDA